MDTTAKHATAAGGTGKTAPQPPTSTDLPRDTPKTPLGPVRSQLYWRQRWKNELARLETLLDAARSVADQAYSRRIANCKARIEYIEGELRPYALQQIEAQTGGSKTVKHPNVKMSFRATHPSLRFVDNEKVVAESLMADEELLNYLIEKKVVEVVQTLKFDKKALIKALRDPEDLGWLSSSIVVDPAGPDNFSVEIPDPKLLIEESEEYAIESDTSHQIFAGKEGSNDK